MAVISFALQGISLIFLLDALLAARGFYAALDRKTPFSVVLLAFFLALLPTAANFVLRRPQVALPLLLPQMYQ